MKLIGILCFLLLIAVFLSAGCANHATTQARQNISTLTDNSLIYGSFLLGSGYVEESLYYFFYIESVDGGYNLGKVLISSTTLYMDEEITPYLLIDYDISSTDDVLIIKYNEKKTSSVNSEGTEHFTYENTSFIFTYLTEEQIQSLNRAFLIEGKRCVRFSSGLKPWTIDRSYCIGIIRAELHVPKGTIVKQFTVDQEY